MDKIKRGIALFLCSLLLGSVLTVGSATDVQAGRQIKTETTQSIKNTNDYIETEASKDQTSDRAAQTKESEKGKAAQTDKVESVEAFFVSPVYARADTIISKERETGIGQIQAEGFTDYNFAAAVYDSLFEAGWLGTAGQTVKEVLGSFQGTINATGYEKKVTYIASAKMTTYNPKVESYIQEEYDTQEEAWEYLDSLNSEPGEKEFTEKKVTKKSVDLETQKPKEELISDITGIEWLREAARIDLKNNAITDLSPLAKERIAALVPESGETEIQNGEKWFGESRRNVELDLTLNPVSKYPSKIGGRLSLNRFGEQANKLEAVEPVYVYIKPENNLFNQLIEVEIPKVLRDGIQIQISKKEADTHIISSNLEGISIDYSNMTNKMPIKGIDSSVYMQIGFLSDDGNGMRYWCTAENLEGDFVTDEATNFKYAFDQMVRIYTKVKPEPPITNTAIVLEKTDAERGNPVEGAKFQLYKVDKDAEGNDVKGELYLEEGQSEEKTPIYETDAEGKIEFNIMLPPGNYCLVEVEAPDGYVLDTTPLFFKVGGGEVKITGGDPSVTPTGGVETVAGENMTYIDRYSPDINLEVIPDEGMELNQIAVTYFDRDTQNNEVEVFSGTDPATEAENFINREKGDADQPGGINGTVIIQPIFVQESSFQVTNEPLYLSFTKVDEQTREALAGAEFTLYKGEENEPDSWEVVKNPVISDQNGMVDFGVVKQGTYFLEETKAPQGYLKPAGYWKVTITETTEDDVKVTFEAKGSDMPAISGSYAEGFEFSNRKTSELPALGGKGTRLFIISGLLIMGSAFALYLKYKRRGA